MQRTGELLRLLSSSGVEFLIIGGVAAIAHGASTFTQDFDIAAAFTQENLARLLNALKPHHPRFALTPNQRPITETPDALSKYKNLYILTDLGRLDVLSEVPPLGTYATVAARAVTMTLFGFECGVLSLDDLIVVKRTMGREKDRLVLVELRALQDRTR